MAEQDLDRSETATPFKLMKAQERGQVAKSSDVVSAVVFTVAVAFLVWRGWETVRTQFRFDLALLMQMGGNDPHGAGLWPLISHLLSVSLALLAPFFASLMLAAILSNVMQTGPVLSVEPVKVDFTRLNPVNGFKKVFSLRTLFDAARACVKLSFLVLVSYFALKSLTPQFYSLANLSPLGEVRTLLDDLGGLGLKMALILGLIALVDLMYTRREFAKKMRMSRRDLKDEHKNREGDPRIRARLRELRREALLRSLSLRKTRNADVLLTNPTHVAVALRYEHGKMNSPQLIAKGAGELAASMRKIAAQHHIPVVQSPTLARKLFKALEVEQHVPAEMYAEVARIIVWVFAMRDQARRTSPRGAGAPA